MFESFGSLTKLKISANKKMIQSCDHNQNVDALMRKVPPTCRIRSLSLMQPKLCWEASADLVRRCPHLEKLAVFKSTPIRFVKLFDWIMQWNPRLRSLRVDHYEKKLNWPRFSNLLLEEETRQFARVKSHQFNTIRKLSLMLRSRDCNYSQYETTSPIQRIETSDHVDLMRIGSMFPKITSLKLRGNYKCVTESLSRRASSEIEKLQILFACYMYHTTLSLRQLSSTIPLISHIEHLSLHLTEGWLEGSKCVVKQIINRSTSLKKFHCSLHPKSNNPLRLLHCESETIESFKLTCESPGEPTTLIQIEDVNTILMRCPHLTQLKLSGFKFVQSQTHIDPKRSTTCRINISHYTQ